mmetsp:Transcript_27771/g.73345  ORF Transcript_27771/g.73345 Transcript_27771/m.73345 type:complete len:150 (+) Transcript_27771:1194-1643(+)
MSFLFVKRTPVGEQPFRTLLVPCQRQSAAGFLFDQSATRGGETFADWKTSGSQNGSGLPTSAISTGVPAFQKRKRMFTFESDWVSSQRFGQTLLANMCLVAFFSFVSVLLFTPLNHWLGSAVVLEPRRLWHGWQVQDGVIFYTPCSGKR